MTAHRRHTSLCYQFSAGVPAFTVTLQARSYAPRPVGETFEVGRTRADIVETDEYVVRTL